MNAPTLAFFGNKGQVGTTWLVYHIAWMLAEMDIVVLVVDLDPQSDLTTAFMDEGDLVDLWEGSAGGGTTVHRCLKPLVRGDEVLVPKSHRVADCLHFLPGDLRLADVEDVLAQEWQACVGVNPVGQASSGQASGDQGFGDQAAGGQVSGGAASGDGGVGRSHDVVDAKLRPGPPRGVSSFRGLIQAGIEAAHAEIVLVDLGPGLGAINRSGLMASDCVVLSVGSDLLSLRGLRGYGAALHKWRGEWNLRAWRSEKCGGSATEAESTRWAPFGEARAIGYLLAQCSLQLTRPIVVNDRWVRRVPAEYARSVLRSEPPGERMPADDPNLVGIVKPFRNLVDLGREARKPIFALSPADGAMGSHAVAVNAAHREFRGLAEELLRRVGLG